MKYLPNEEEYNSIWQVFRNDQHLLYCYYCQQNNPGKQLEYGLLYACVSEILMSHDINLCNRSITYFVIHIK